MQREDLFSVSGDVLNLLKISKEIGWHGIRRASIHRIFYLAAVLYKFIHSKGKNIFSSVYNFNVSIRGPYCDLIEASLAFLNSDDYIIIDDKTGVINIGTKKTPDISDIKTKEKEDWLRIILFILGVYGEDKIYDFVFRDPEYENKMQINSTKSIDLESNNYTLSFLKEFKHEFENATRITKVDPKRYLNLYFEYVFSIILKGEN